MARRRRVAADDGPTWVYQAMCEHGGLLYVGVAHDVPRRIAQHRSTKSWWREVDIVCATRYESRTEALAVEARMIRGERPPHNIAGRPPVPSASSYSRQWLALDARGHVLDGR